MKIHNYVHKKYHKYVNFDIFLCVCLHYLLTVYPPMLPKHNKKLLTLLFSHIISINPQNYNLFISSTPTILATYPSYYHMQCVTTYSL